MDAQSEPNRTHIQKKSEREIVVTRTFNAPARIDGSITTVTFDERDGKTLLTLSELYPSKEAFERAGGSENGMSESFDRLDAFLATSATA